MRCLTGKRASGGTKSACRGIGTGGVEIFGLVRPLTNHDRSGMHSQETTVAGVGQRTDRPPTDRGPSEERRGQGLGGEGSGWGRWGLVAVYAVAMAWVESAVVLYLRTITGRMDPYSPEPLKPLDGIGLAEVVREAATLIMLSSVGWLAGRTWRSRLGYLLVAFGIWDIFYYLFLILLTAWPRSLLDWDILFLIPLPWWGPVLAPVSIAALMIAGGTLLGQYDSAAQPLWPHRWAVGLSALGAVLALYVFMADALRIAEQGIEALRKMLPVRFDWPLFILAWLLMATALVDLGLQVWRRRRGGPEKKPGTLAPPPAEACR